MFGDGKRERKVKRRGGWNENVKSVDAGERRGDRRCMKKKEQREFQKLEITCCRKHVLLSGLRSWKPGERRLGRWEQTVTPPPAKCLQSGTGRGAQGPWRWQRLPDFTKREERKVCATSEGTEALLGVALNLIVPGAYRASHFNVLFTFRLASPPKRTEKPKSRLGTFLLLWKAGPVLPLTGASSASPGST